MVPNFEEFCLPKLEEYLVQAIEKVRDLVLVHKSRSRENQTPLEWDVKVGSHIFELVEVLKGR